MGLLDQIRKDAERFASDANDFAIAMTFTDKAYNNATITGLYTRHHTKIEADGSTTNSKTCSICVSETKLIDAGYEVRNDDGDVAMDGHLVTFKDFTGVDTQYKITEQLPDETVGLIVFILSEYAED